ncbi:MAG: hypothetical protein ACLPVY_21560 [Acidimicrobiia bacterium]
MDRPSASAFLCAALIVRVAVFFAAGRRVAFFEVLREVVLAVGIWIPIHRGVGSERAG